MLVTPSILTSTPQEAFRQIDRLLPYFKTFQIDIADGKFVPNTTMSIPQITEYLRHTKGHLRYDSCTFDFHLMVEDYVAELEYLDVLKALVTIGVVMIHSQCKPNLRELSKKFPQYSIGLVLNPEDAVQEMLSYYTLSEVPFIQIMSVNPGFQGAPFIVESLTKIDQLRAAGYRFKIYLDGGVNAETLPVIVARENPPNCIGPGSYLSKAENIEDRVKELNILLEGTKP